MRSYLVGGIVGAVCANANLFSEKAQEFLHSNKSKTKKTSETKESNGTLGDGNFTQANCDTSTYFYVPELPGFDNTKDTWPCSYAGTLPGNEEATHELFFWLYPATDPDAPVAIWLNGGPGASSTFANFLFSSPLRIAEPTPGTFEMYTSEETWITDATMIYIDQPVGTGFSYGEPLLTTLDECSDEFINLMVGIWESFPDLQGKDLYVTGESYAGKYIPRFSWALYQDGRFNLKASLIGDPYTAPLTQRTHTYLVPEALNIIDDSNMPQIAALQKNCQEMLAVDLDQADETCADIVDYVSQVSGDVFPYDNRIFGADWDKMEDPVINYFTTQDAATLSTIWYGINVEGSTKSPVFCMSCGPVGEALVSDNLLDYSQYVEKLIAAESPVLIYAGEFDAQDGPKTQEFWLRRMNFAGSDDFWAQSRQIYWVQNFTATDTQLINGGYWRTSDYFEYLTVPKAGHFVPNNYFSASYQFFSDYIKNTQKLECHKSDGTACSVVAARCTAMNDCNGQGTCNYATAQCECNAGYKFADCSKQVIDLTDEKTESIVTNGPGWFTMAYSGDKSSKFSLNPNVTSDIYILKSASGDPNNFVYDMSFKGVTGNTTFDADNLGLTSDQGYSVAVYISAINETANLLLNANMDLYFSEGAQVLLGASASALALAVAATLA